MIILSVILVVIIFYTVFVRCAKGSVKFIGAGLMEKKQTSSEATDKLIEVIESSVDDNGDEIAKSKTTEENEPLKVQIKDNKLQSDKIIEYEGEEIKMFEFRPQTWGQFISQEFAKEQAKTIMKKAHKGIKCHYILSAIKGHGKTTFVELFAKSLGAKLIQRVGKQIDEDELLNIVNEINTSTEKFVVLFIDEIDSMDWKVIKILNPIIEQFKINNKRIKPFIFASATINKHLLVKNNPDTLDRISHHIQFTRYNQEDIAQIIAQYKNQLYPTEQVSNEVIQVISKNCKFNPRTSISLLEDYIVELDVNKVLKNRHIVEHGLTNLDIKILDILGQATRAMGANALATRVGLGESQYLREYEPFLVEFGYVARIPSRVITDKGKELLNTIERSQ